MKKLFTIVLAVAVAIGSLNAQKTSSAFAKGDNVLSLAVGFGLSAPIFGLVYERGFMNDIGGVKGLNLGIGGQAGYFSYSSTSNAGGAVVRSHSSSFSAMARGALHYQFLAKLDTYVALGVGISYSSSNVSSKTAGVNVNVGDSGVGFGSGFLLGARYYIMDNLAAGAEFGLGSAVGRATITIAYKF